MARSAFLGPLLRRRSPLVRLALALKAWLTHLLYGFKQLLNSSSSRRENTERAV